LSFLVAPDFDAPADAGADNVYEVVVRVSDGALASTQAIAVSVSNTDDSAPVLVVNSLSIAQGGIATALIQATDADTAPAQLTFSVSGLSGGHFERIGAPSLGVTSFTQADVDAGLLRFVADGGEAAPVYQLTVSDGVRSSAAQTATVSFTNINDAPVITSLGGAPAATLAVFENSVAVATVSATDRDALDVLRFAIAGGADAALFAIDAVSGELSFLTPPDRELPADADADNRYEVIVSVSDGSLQAQQSLSIVVGNVDEAPTIIVNTLLLSRDGATLVLLGTDPDSAAAALQYVVSGALGGRFERVTTPGIAITGFSQAEVSAATVRFVVDGSGVRPTYVLSLSDGVSTVTSPAPDVTVQAAPVADVVATPAPENLPPPAAPTSAAPVQTARPPVAAAPAEPQAPTPGHVSQDSLAERRDPAYEPAQAPAKAVASVAPASPSGNQDARVKAVTTLVQFALLSESAEDTAATSGLINIDLASALRERLLGQELDQLRDAAESSRHMAKDVQSASVMVSTGLSVGYVLWLARGGVLMASLMSALPAWAMVDPLPVLAQVKRRDGPDDPKLDDGDADDALENLFSKEKQAPASPAPRTVAPLPVASPQPPTTLAAQAESPDDQLSKEQPA
ncbi:MAG: cadherin-like domain-containing protein, partial [Burkholderiaceae bacterium]